MNGVVVYRVTPLANSNTSSDGGRKKLESWSASVRGSAIKLCTEITTAQLADDKHSSLLCQKYFADVKTFMTTAQVS
jgi:hypothetical protein